MAFIFFNVSLFLGADHRKSSAVWERDGNQHRILRDGRKITFFTGVHPSEAFISNESATGTRILSFIHLSEIFFGFYL